LAGKYLLLEIQFGRVLRSLIGFTFPIVVSSIGFLVLYNNLDWGLLILILVLGFNIFLLIISGILAPKGPLLNSCRLGAICVIAVASTFVFLETAFPLILPTDYAQTSRFVKGPQGEVTYLDFKPDVVFDQSEKISPESTQAERIFCEKRSWHKPGHAYLYLGYDPNKKIRYLNRIKWNETGYFDHEYSVIKPADVYRVIVIGDSYVESVQVPLKSTFHKLTEVAANSSGFTLNNKRYQIIALGNSGFGQRENLDVLRTQGLKYDPDLVIVSLCGNDFCDDDPVLKSESILSGGSITPLVRKAASHGYFAVAFMIKRIDDLHRNRIKMSPELLQWSSEDIPIVEAAWRRSLDNIRAQRDLCQNRGVTFLLLYVGSEIEVKNQIDPGDTIASLKAMGGVHQSMDWDISKSVRRVRNYCQENDINFACTLGQLAGSQKDTGNKVFADHYSFFGHEVVAKALTCFLREFTVMGKRVKDSIDGCFPQQLIKRGSTFTW
jgi:hypothetical protein